MYLYALLRSFKVMCIWYMVHDLRELPSKAPHHTRTGMPPHGQPQFGHRDPLHQICTMTQSSVTAHGYLLSYDNLMQVKLSSHCLYNVPISLTSIKYAASMHGLQSNTELSSQSLSQVYEKGNLHGVAGTHSLEQLLAARSSVFCSAAATAYVYK